MIKKLLKLPILLAVTFFSGSLAAAVDYEVQDIGTFQTYCSKPIAINDAGEILGWFDLDGSGVYQYGFLRYGTGSFSGVPLSVNGMDVEWKFLTNDGSAYGIHLSGNTVTLFVWSQEGGAINLGKLPGNEVTAVNDSGQVLIKSVSDTLDGKQICYPVIWEHGKITKLEGLPGNLGIPSERAYGLDLNNHGDVVGYSKVNIVYKNRIYVQTHATKWINGQPIDLHKVVPRQEVTEATVINDDGDVVINNNLVSEDGSKIKKVEKMTRGARSNYFVSDKFFYGTEPNGQGDNILNLSAVIEDDSMWIRADRLIDINSSGEIIAMGTTIYGESHAMLFRPIK